NEKNICLFTFAGNKVNYTLALMLKYVMTFETFEVTSFQLTLPVHLRVEDIKSNIERFKNNSNYYFSSSFISRFTKFFPEIEYSKFQSFLPRELSNEYLGDLILDIPKTEFVCKNFNII
ncbi:MAG: hypothetical protein H7263_11485, partial [Candidatus Sericytochromatia bacterium]|nr:hypothetical protein [Candidatus Sericytochromatia bacterium]